MKDFISQHDYFCANGAPIPQTVYLVSAVHMDCHGKVGLIIADKPARDWTMGVVGWDHAYFRKLVSASDRIAQQEEGLIPHQGFWDARPDLP